jgi:DNA repair protein RecN (Recombination protein N)
VAADLSSYASSVDADPARLDAVQRRLSDLVGLTRKYAEDVDGVIAWAQSAERRLGELDDDGRVERLAAEHDRLLSELTAAATALSTARGEAARRLENAVSTELAALAMPNATLTVELSQRDDPRGIPVGGRSVSFGPHGVDEVELTLAAHAGATPRQLHKGASGGELSRVMLALEVVLAGVDAVPTFVFDEVDAGVGGRAAVEVGARLARLARTAQVIVVTHLPQVAAFADAQVAVRKNDDGRVTTTDVAAVEGALRVEELSRMLAGLADSQLGRGHAEELLAVAAATKKDVPKPGRSR